MSLRSIVPFVAACLAVPAASATISAGVTGGTLGIGPTLGIREAMFGAHADATFLGFDHSFNTDDLHYDGHARLRSVGAMADLYPFGGGFRLSAGARYNMNRARAIATPTQNTSVGGMVFTPAQIGTLNGHAEVRHFAPAATLGWGGRLTRGFFFGADAGALFQGRIRISNFTSSTGMVPQDRLDRERAELQHDADDYKVYPIAQLSVGFRF